MRNSRILTAYSLGTSECPTSDGLIKVAVDIGSRTEMEDPQICAVKYLHCKGEARERSLYRNRTRNEGSSNV